MTAAASRPTRNWVVAGAIALLVVIGLFGLPVPVADIVPVTWVLATGWVAASIRAAPVVGTYRDEVLTGATFLALFAVGLHLLAWCTARAVGRSWCRRSTAAATLIVLVLFISGLACECFFVGLVAHRKAAERATTNNMKQIGLAMHIRNASLGSFPPGYTVDTFGQPKHGWQTHLLPFLEHDVIYQRIDLERPWDDPVNRGPLSAAVPQYRSSFFDAGYDSDGYNLSHFAGNSHVFRGSKRRGPRVHEFIDGASNTILFGEVSAGFHPWGHALNVRDPGRGLRPAADTFAGPWAGGVTWFGFGDASVRAVKPTASPAVLRALATPAGRDDVSAAELDTAFDKRNWK